MQQGNEADKGTFCKEIWIEIGFLSRHLIESLTDAKCLTICFPCGQDETLDMLISNPLQSEDLNRTFHKCNQTRKVS